MKYCSKCGRELFDKDIECDKCKSIDFISEKECKEIIREINNANMFSKKKLLKDHIYKMVNDFIINKPKNYFAQHITNSNNESNEEYFNRINQHTIKQSTKHNIHCPYCNSTNVTKIGTVNRAVSVGMLGLASSKIGKTHKCNDCGSTW